MALTPLKCQDTLTNKILTDIRLFLNWRAVFLITALDLSYIVINKSTFLKFTIYCYGCFANDLENKRRKAAVGAAILMTGAASK